MFDPQSLAVGLDLAIWSLNVVGRIMLAVGWIQDNQDKIPAHKRNPSLWQVFVRYPLCARHCAGQKQYKNK